MVPEYREIPIALPSTGEEEWYAVRDSLMTGWLTQGPKVSAFEKAFAARHGVRYAVAASSCTTALHLILTALGIGPGDEVIVPAFTWVATSNVVIYCGATPVFADIHTDTFNVDAAEIAAKINKHTKAVIAVHLFGLCADIDSIKDVAHGIPVIEDAACAAGSYYNNRPAGSHGLAGAFSFHPRKSITTGEGGMITTDDKNLAETITVLRNHGASIAEEQRHVGQTPYLLPEFNMLGFNYRMTDLQGAVGLVQLSKLDAFIAERHKRAVLYENAFSDVRWLKTPSVSANCRHGWQSYVCYVDEGKAPMRRDELMRYLLSKGIHTRSGTHAVHMLGYYRDRFGFKPEHYSRAWDCQRYTMAIPLHNRMTTEDYEYVIRTIREIA
ncbi:MAG: DegT/DnrJ/EryC1/StrS family aminotransferase [Nitrospirota bacterium]